MLTSCIEDSFKTAILDPQAIKLSRVRSREKVLETGVLNDRIWDK